MLKYNQLGEANMLKYFEVKNYKGFKDGLSIDFSNHRDYTFHGDFIKNNIVNNSIPALLFDIRQKSQGILPTIIQTFHY